MTHALGGKTNCACSVEICKRYGSNFEWHCEFKFEVDLARATSNIALGSQTEFTHLGSKLVIAESQPAQILITDSESTEKFGSHSVLEGVFEYVPTEIHAPSPARITRRYIKWVSQFAPI